MRKKTKHHHPIQRHGDSPSTQTQSTTATNTPQHTSILTIGDVQTRIFIGFGTKGKSNEIHSITPIQRISNVQTQKHGASLFDEVAVGIVTTRPRRLLRFGAVIVLRPYDGRREPQGKGDERKELHGKDSMVSTEKITRGRRGPTGREECHHGHPRKSRRGANAASKHESTLGNR